MIRVLPLRLPRSGNPSPPNSFPISPPPSRAKAKDAVQTAEPLLRHRRDDLDVGMDGVRALIAAGATAVCCIVCSFWVLRSPSSKKKQRSCGCRARSANGEMAVGGENKKKAQDPAPESGGGASMMEQLVPEITTHALSYLDYTSLCRLSMTNSAMRRAANDDGAWKALYHKVRPAPSVFSFIDPLVGYNLQM
jgi:hypothetical protein